MGSVAAPLVGHLDAALTNFAKKFQQNGLVADRLAPTVPVGRQTDKYYIFGRESQELNEKQLRATGAAAEAIRIALSTDSYFCRSHALKSMIADEDRQGYEAGDLEIEAVQTMMAKIQLQREKELATMLADTAQVTQNTTLSGTSQWSDYANSKPIDIIEAGKTVIRKSGVEPNFMVVGEPVYTKLINNPSIVDRFKYVQPGSIGVPELASLFGVEEFLVARAVEFSGTTASFIWGKHAWLGYRSQAASRMDISGVKTFRWTAAPGTSGGIGVVTGRHPDPTAKSDIVGVDDYYQQKITAVETLYLIKDAVA